jgi:MFS family permease
MRGTRVSGMRTERPGTAAIGKPFSWRFVTPMYVGSALNPINSTAIATALVGIAAALRIPVGQTSILISVLYLTCAIAQPTAGKLSEELGPRRVFVAGILTLLAGGLIGGFGVDLGMLIVSRVLIGAGTSSAYPSAMVMIRRRAAAAKLASPPGNVLGGLSIAGQATVALGPTIGGLLVGIFNWRAAFFLNVPLSAAALLMALLWLPADGALEHGGFRAVATRIDLTGIAGFGVTVTAVLLFLLGLPHVDWVPLTVAVIAGVALVRWERRVSRPFLDVRMLASNGPLARTYLRFGLTLLGVYVILYGLPEWMEVALHLSPGQSGLLLIPMGAIATVISRPIARRNLVRGPLIISAVCLLLGGLATLFLTDGSPLVAILGVTALFGITTGTTAVSTQTALYVQTPAETVGTASGLLRTSGYLGSVASATITGAAFRSQVGDTGLHTLATVLLGIGIVVLLLTVLDRTVSSPEHDQSRE